MSDRPEQVRIDRIDQMPTLPEPYEMRDWAAVARAFDALAFDLDREGDHLPLVSLDDREHNYEGPSFGLPSYVGQPDGDEAINCLGAVVGASLAGVDKTRAPGDRDWVRMCRHWFNRDNGQDLYLNTKRQETGNTFWYEVFPTVLFARLADLYPDVEEFEGQLRTVADRWYEACAVLGDGDVSDPDFDWTAFDFEAMEPRLHGEQYEPEAAAGVAFIEYAAYTEFGDERYLDAAEGALEFFETFDRNPLYEVLLPIGAYTAARLNAEHGRDYDVSRLVEWSFGPSDTRPGWGVVADRWGDADCHGLVGSVSDSDGYGFAMNTFEYAAALVPLVRYDQRFATAVGKWLLNAANAARLFYPGFLPPADQDNYAWSEAHDEADCLAYEGLRSLGWGAHTVAADHETRAGTVSGTFEATDPSTDDTQVIESDGGALDHVWRLRLPAAQRHMFSVQAAADAPVTISYATDSDGPYTPLFTVDAPDGDRYRTDLTEKQLVWQWNYDGDVYVRAERDGEGDDARLRVDGIGAATIMARPDDPYCSDDPGPHGTGDALSGFGSRTNLGVYGSSHVGMLGALVEPTDVEGVLRLDCLATDFFAPEAYPTYLYYNPHDESVSVSVDVGEDPVDVYDAVAGGFRQHDVRESTTLELPPRDARVVVLPPAGGETTVEDGTVTVDGVAVDYRYE
jgi:hypothetical protein